MVLFYFVAHNLTYLQFQFYESLFRLWLEMYLHEHTIHIIGLVIVVLWRFVCQKLNNSTLNSFSILHTINMFYNVKI